MNTQNRTTYNHYGKPEEYPDGYIPPFMCVLTEDEDYHAGWYFFDECGETHGPFESFEKAKGNCDKYIKDIIDSTYHNE